MTRIDHFPFYDWVPKWLGILIHIFLFFPIIFISGAYTSNASEMTGELGIISEHIQYSNFATAVGMVVFAPFVVHYLLMRRPKMAFLLGFNLLFILSAICARTGSMVLLMICSFFTGCIRIMLIFNNLFCLIKFATHQDPINSFIPGKAPDDIPTMDKMDYVKATSVPVLYLFFISLGQIGSSITAWLAYEYQWQYVYYGMMGLALGAILLVETTMKYQKQIWDQKIHVHKLGDFVAASIFELSVCYILVYGKTYDWFDDESIRLAAGLALVSLGLFVVLQTHTMHPYLRFSIFKRHYTWVAILMFMLLMLVNSHSALISVYTGIGMDIDNWKAAQLNNYGMIGHVLGVIISVAMAKHNIEFRYIFAVGFLCIGLSAIYMYFYFQPQGLYNDLILPTILRSAGMIILYAMSAIYGMKRLPAILLPSWIFVMLTFRSVIGPVVGTSVFTNLINQRQEQHLTEMVNYQDASNADFSGSYQKKVAGGKYSGLSLEDASTLAAMNVKGSVQKQAVLVTLKEICGWTIYATVGFIFLSLIFPYPNSQQKE